MAQHADTADALGNTVEKLRTFVPAKDFEQSKRFYADLGFRVACLDDNLAEVALGNHSFLLQNYFVEPWASNAMMHSLVNDLDRCWSHIAGLDLRACYGVPEPKPPKLESWGLRVAYVDRSLRGALAHRGAAAVSSRSRKLQVPQEPTSGSKVLEVSDTRKKFRTRRTDDPSRALPAARCRMPINGQNRA